MVSIFLSYSRDDTSGHAGRLYDHLAGYFGRESLFFDRSSLDPGIQWEREISVALDSCKAVLALIGRNWLEGVRRESFARRELILALSLKRSIYPLLVEGAVLSEIDTPEELRPILGYQAVTLPEDSLYQEAVLRLCQTLEGALGLRGGAARRHLEEGFGLLEEKFWREAWERFRLAAQEKSTAAEAFFYMAVAVLAGRSVDALRPAERKEVERCLGLARRGSRDWLPPLVLFGILELDYYDEHGMVSENGVSVADVARRWSAAPPEEKESRFLRFVFASPQARLSLGLDR